MDQKVTVISLLSFLPDMDRVLYYGSSTQVHSGASQWMHRLAAGTSERGWDTIAVLPDDEGIASWYRDAGLDIRYLWSEPLRVRRSLVGHLRYLLAAVWFTISLAYLVRREQVDVVHVNEIRYPFGLVAGKLGGATTVCHVRACLQSSIVRAILSRFVVLFSDEIMCVSNRTKEVMFEEVGIERDEIRVVYDGLPSPERFERQTDGSSFRDEVGIGDSSFLALQVSKLTRNKGQDRMLDVAERFFKEDEDVEFAIVGGPVEGHEEYVEMLRNRASYLPNVHLTGFYSDIVPAIAAADVLVHVPRHDDPFPGVVLEGMTAGKPVVGSRSGGIPEQIVDGETGFLVPKTGGESTIAECLRHLREDESDRKQMGENAARHAFSAFPVEKHFDEIAAVYDRVSA
jgi:glycosyltransferase involved in cell wall biosynthesis